MRTPARVGVPTIARVKSFPAPTSGWIANENLAAPDVRSPDGSTLRGAVMLTNWFPTATGVRMRGGSDLYATIGSGTDDVTALFSYAAGGNEKLFSATATDIYDVTTVVDPEVSPTAVVASQTGGDWVSCQFATSGGVFLRLVNGTDTPRVYDGTTWGTSPAITGPTTVSKLSYVWAFAKRLFFIEKETLDAWYLAVDSIGGAATKFPMGGVFQRGGSLLFGATWSLDDRGGLSASCIFATTEGEIAVYQGLDPASWSLVGVYQIGRPLGAKAWLRAGGDVVVLTDIGAIPLSQAISRDMAAIAPAAISYPIENEWNDAVASRIGAWVCEIWPTQQMALVALPTSSGDEPQIFVANARTGAWCLYTGWQATCFQAFGDRLFFGSVNGKVIEAEVTGSDQGATYTASCISLFNDLKTPASMKTVGLARAVLLAPNAINEKLSIQTDYAISLPTVPDDVATVGNNLWGSGLWGTSVWGAGRVRSIYQKWRSVFGMGCAIAPAIQITSGTLAAPDVELVRIDVTYDTADIVT